MEINMTENEFWNIDELVALTDRVQTSEIEYNEKKLKIQYCELTEGEEPKLDLPSTDASEEEQNIAYQKIGQARILAMITKANDKNPKGATVTNENWNKLPSTIRWGLSQTILSGDGVSFREVDE
jgi:G:T/U-mismatch repair DNA glycosylase